MWQVPWRRGRFCKRKCTCKSCIQSTIHHTTTIPIPLPNNRKCQLPTPTLHHELTVLHDPEAPDNVPPVQTVLGNDDAFPVRFQLFRHAIHDQKSERVLFDRPENGAAALPAADPKPVHRQLLHTQTANDQKSVQFRKFRQNNQKPLLGRR